MDEKYLQKIIETEQSVKSAHHRIDKVEADVGEITKATREDVNDMNGRLKVVEDKPAQRWETIVKAVLTSIGSGLAGAGLALLLK